MKSVILQPLGLVSQDLLFDLKTYLIKVIDVDVYIANKSIEIPRAAFNPVRGQYNSTYILNYLKVSSSHLPYDKVIGIADIDAYVEGLNFVFGEAELGGRVGVVYLGRLRPEFYGGEEDYELLLIRTLKEVLHELGHTFGLLHCANRRCVMTFSNSIFDTDYKEANFCKECSKRLNARGVIVLSPID